MPTISHAQCGLRWRAYARYAAPLEPSTSLRAWLLDSGSLTQKLLALSGGEFEVKVLQQSHARARRSEALALGIGFHQRCLIREVILYGRNQPWVFARSVLPLASLTGRLRHLRKQGTRPLGAFLFSQPQLQRSPIALALINGHHGYLPAALIGDVSPIGDATQLWGRRSVFSLDHKPLLVSEVFLPELVRALR